jgi:hypothetical protein
VCSTDRDVFLPLEPRSLHSTLHFHLSLTLSKDYILPANRRSMSAPHTDTFDLRGTATSVMESVETRARNLPGVTQGLIVGSCVGYESRSS